MVRGEFFQTPLRNVYGLGGRSVFFCFVSANGWGADPLNNKANNNKAATCKIIITIRFLLNMNELPAADITSGHGPKLAVSIVCEICGQNNPSYGCLLSDKGNIRRRIYEIFMSSFVLHGPGENAIARCFRFPYNVNILFGESEWQMLESILDVFPLLSGVTL